MFRTIPIWDIQDLPQDIQEDVSDCLYNALLSDNGVFKSQVVNKLTPVLLADIQSRIDNSVKSLQTLPRTCKVAKVVVRSATSEGELKRIKLTVYSKDHISKDVTITL